MTIARETRLAIHTYAAEGYKPAEIVELARCSESTVKRVLKETPLGLSMVGRAALERCRHEDHAWLEGDGPQRDYAIEEPFEEYRGRTLVTGRRRVCAFCGEKAVVGEPTLITTA